MERPRLPPLPPLPPLLAAAVILGCCARPCPSLGSGTGSTPGAATPCARLGTAAGERCRTGPEQGAGTGRTPTAAAVGQLWAEAELLPSSGASTRTVEPPSPQGSPRGPWAGREGTGPAVRDRTATEHPGLSMGTAELAAAGTERPSPAPARLEPDTAPGTDPGGAVTVEGATAPQGVPSRSPSSAMEPSSAEGHWESPSTVAGWSPMRTELVQGQRGTHGPSSPQPWAGEGGGVTVLLGDSSPGTHPNTTPGTTSPAPGTVGTSPFVWGLQRELSPSGTPRGMRQGLSEPAGGRDSGSRPWHGKGPSSAPRPSSPTVGGGGPGGPVTSTAQTDAGTEAMGLPVPTATAGTPGVSSPGTGGVLGPTSGVLGLSDTVGPPEHSPVPLDQAWRLPAVPSQPPAAGSTAVAQSGVSHPRPGSAPTPRQPGPDGGSAAPTPQPSAGTSRGAPGLSPTAATPRHRLPHARSGGDSSESPRVLVKTPTGMGDAGPWAAAAPPSWHPESLAPSSAPGGPQQPTPSQPMTSRGPSTAIAATTTSTSTATSPRTAATGSPALLEGMGRATLEPGAAVSQGNAAGLTWEPPAVVPGPPQQPTDRLGTLGHRGGSGPPPAAGDADLVLPSSSPGGWAAADGPRATPAPAAAGRAPRVFIVEDQPPLLKASLLRVPCELVLDMAFVPALQDPGSQERRGLLQSFNRTVAPLFTSVPGFLRLEVTGIREGSVVLEYDALFAAERVRVPGLGALLDAALRSGGTGPGLAVGAAPVLRNVALERPLDPCAALFACRAGFACVAGADGNASCTSLCHRDYCKNHGICTHPPDRGPLCQCPVGSDFWFMGLRCDYRVTQQSLLGMAAGVLLSIVLLGAVLAAIAIRRFKVLLLEARADQTRSSYRRFCRLDDVSAQYWSRSWLPSASSLDNPAFSNSEELLHLQVLDNGCCGCREDAGTTGGAKQRPAPPTCPPRRPSFHYDWDSSSSSMNDPMVDSGKASDISVSSWPMEPLQWAPFPLLHQLSRQRPHKARRPHSYCEGVELVNLERSWTA